MMPIGTRYDSGIGLPDVDDGGDGPRGCEWGGSVCVDSPTHFIEWGTHGDESAELTTSVYCARHYSVELAHYTEFHIRDCSQPAINHISKIRKIGS